MNDKEHGCNCGHDHDHDHEDIDIIYLTLDDDTELECEVLGIFEVEDKEYIALLPLDEEDADVLLYQYEEINDEEFNLAQIEDEEEFELVSEAFNALFLEDDFEFDDYDDDDEE